MEVPLHWPGAIGWQPTHGSEGLADTAWLAEREGIAPSYMTRVLRLTPLAPDIVEAILDGRQGAEMTLARVLEPFPGEWERYRRKFRLPAPDP